MCGRLTRSKKSRPAFKARWNTTLSHRSGSAATRKPTGVHVDVIGTPPENAAEASNMLLEINDAITVIVVGVAAFMLVMLRFG